MGAQHVGPEILDPPAEIMRQCSFAARLIDRGAAYGARYGGADMLFSVFAGHGSYPFNEAEAHLAPENEKSAPRRALHRTTEGLLLLVAFDREQARFVIEHDHADIFAEAEDLTFGFHLHGREEFNRLGKRVQALINCFLWLFGRVVQGVSLFLFRQRLALVLSVSQIHASYATAFHPLALG
jgi:hypothetical protein